MVVVFWLVSKWNEAINIVLSCAMYLNCTWVVSLQSFFCCSSWPNSLGIGTSALWTPMNHASDQGLQKGNDQATKDHFSQSNILIRITNVSYRWHVSITTVYNYLITYTLQVAQRKEYIELHVERILSHQVVPLKSVFLFYFMETGLCNGKGHKKIATYIRD